MRVLAMVHAYPPRHNAGGELTIHALLRALVNEGHDVDVLVSRDEPAAGNDLRGAPIEDVDGVSVYYNRGNAGPFDWFGTKTNSPDVVFAHLENTLRAAALCDIHQVPMVHVLHNDHAFTKGALLRGPTHLAVFNTDWMADAYSDYWQHSTSKYLPSIVVHPVVDPDDWTGVKPGQAATLINLNEDKGGNQFWALAQALPKRQFLGVRGAYGPQVTGDAFNVTLLDHQRPEDMPAVYAQTRVLLMPSIYESYGRTAVEAAYCGIPTIAHPTPGLREALGDAGIFVDRDDTDGWLKELSRLYTPKGWAAASRKVKAHAHSLKPEDDLNRFVDAVEGVVRRGFATYAR